MNARCVRSAKKKKKILLVFLRPTNPEFWVSAYRKGMARMGQNDLDKNRGFWAVWDQAFTTR